MSAVLPSFDCDSSSSLIIVAENNKESSISICDSPAAAIVAEDGITSGSEEDGDMMMNPSKRKLNDSSSDIIGGQADSTVAKKSRKRDFTLKDKRDLVRRFLCKVDFAPIDGLVNGRQLDENGIAAFLHIESQTAPNEVTSAMLQKWILQYKQGYYEDFSDYPSATRLNCSKEKVLW